MSEPTAGGDPHVMVEVLSQPRYLSGARDLVSAVSKRLGFDDTACSQIALAVDEALCNIIRHGYDQRADGKIWISIWPVDGDGGGIRIQIDDRAKQVDPKGIKSRDLDDIRPGGLGVHIIHQVMDEARYEQREGGGMRLSMRKYKTPSRRKEQGVAGGEGA